MIIEKGVCGKNLTWKLNAEGVLAISGEGEMGEWIYRTSPWYRHRSKIKKIIIGNGVTSIGEYAFYDCSELTSVTIGNSVTSIGRCAFEGCFKLKNITIPNSVTLIGNYAFSGCSGLISITIPNSVTSISNDVFSGCSELTSVTIPNSVTSIGYAAFNDCSSLTNITIPNSVTSISGFAFYNCSKLKNVTIPDSVTSIGQLAFAYCFGLKKYNNRYFKITDKNMKCRDFQYEMDKWYINEGNIVPCKSGFHSCRRSTDCFNYYCGNLDNLRFFEVEVSGEIIEHNDKICSEKIKFIKEYTFKEFIELVNE